MSSYEYAPYETFRDAYIASQVVVDKHPSTLRAEGWGMFYDSQIDDYDKRIYGVLEGVTIAQLIEDIEEPFVIDLMSSSAALASLYLRQQHKPNKRGIAVSLHDLRTEYQKTNDSRLGISQLALNLAFPKSFDILADEMSGSKAHVIMESARGGLDGIPNHEHYYKFAMGRLWTMLDSTNGHLILQTPANIILGETSIDYGEWLKEVQQSGIFARPAGSYLYLRKNNETPLPLPR